MPYYLVMPGPTYVGERETHHMVFHRPISFVEEVHLGKREHGFIGSKEAKLEINSHDESIVTALRDTTLILRPHEKRPDQEEIIEANHPPVTESQLTGEDEKYRVVELKKGAKLNLYKSSFMIEGKGDEQVRWASSMHGPQGALFSDFAMGVLEREGF